MSGGGRAIHEMRRQEHVVDCAYLFIYESSSSSLMQILTQISIYLPALVAVVPFGARLITFAEDAFSAGLDICARLVLYFA